MAVVDYASNDGTITVFVGDHHMELGPRGSGGYCYAHQTFDCTLTPEQKDEVDEAEKWFDERFPNARHQ